MVAETRKQKVCRCTHPGNAVPERANENAGKSRGISDSTLPCAFWTFKPSHGNPLRGTSIKQTIRTSIGGTYQAETRDENERQIHRGSCGHLHRRIGTCPSAGPPE